MTVRNNSNGTLTIEASKGFDIAHFAENGNVIRRIKSVLIRNEIGLLDWVEIKAK